MYLYIIQWIFVFLFISHIIRSISVDGWSNSLTVPYISPNGSTSNDIDTHKNNNSTNSAINNNNNNIINNNNNNNYFMKENFRSNIKGSPYQDGQTNSDATKQSSSYFNDISCTM